MPRSRDGPLNSSAGSESESPPQLDHLVFTIAAPQGATAALSPKEAAVGVDAIVTMVPNDKVLRDVVSNPETGLLHSLKGVHISCSTIHPDTARELAALHEANGSQYVGAPIFARADGVAARLASFVVGGTNEAFERVRPLLEANSNGIYRFGEDAGAGALTRPTRLAATRHACTWPRHSQETWSNYAATT